MNNHQPLKEAVLNQLPCNTECFKQKSAAEIELSAENQSIEKSVEPHFDTCLLHSKQADLICLQDHCLICANCGLFG
jgi:hypothetical protein